MQPPCAAAPFELKAENCTNSALKSLSPTTTGPGCVIWTGLSLGRAEAECPEPCQPPCVYVRVAMARHQRPGLHPQRRAVARGRPMFRGGVRRRAAGPYSAVACCGARQAYVPQWRAVAHGGAWGVRMVADHLSAESRPVRSAPESQALRHRGAKQRCRLHWSAVACGQLDPTHGAAAVRGPVLRAEPKCSGCLVLLNHYVCFVSLSFLYHFLFLESLC